MADPILRLAALRELEKTCADRTPPLMTRAGEAAADKALRLMVDAALGGPPLIVAGPGNNGGDALVMARLLRARGLKPTVVLVGDEARLPPDALDAYRAWRASGGDCLRDVPPGRYGLVVDGLFGIGLTRPLTGEAAGWVDRINRFGGPVLALDCPSGLDADTGHTPGPAVRATHTLTFIALKPGLLTNDGPDHCGEIEVADLGLTADVARLASGETLDMDGFEAWRQPRRHNTHKGSYGSAGILGGAAGMTGAALLAARAALKLGAGRVYAGLLAPLAVDPQQPELMLRTPEEVLSLSTALAIGPGLGQGQGPADAAGHWLDRAIDSALPLVVDADALNLLAARPVLAERLARRLARRAVPTILTPHPAEAARLLGWETDRVQADRVATATGLARRFQAAVVIKGTGSIVALPDGRWRINPTGNPGLATAGSGDVLTGLIVALLAQGWPAEAALGRAVHLHGQAADVLARQVGGTTGLTAGELIDTARQCFNAWIAHA